MGLKLINVTSESSVVTWNHVYWLLYHSNIDYTCQPGASRGMNWGIGAAHTYTHTQWNVAVETVVFLQQWSLVNRIVRTAATTGRITALIQPHIHTFYQMMFGCSSSHKQPIRLLLPCLPSNVIQLHEDPVEIKFNTGILIWKLSTGAWLPHSLVNSGVMLLFPIIFFI